MDWKVGDKFVSLVDVNNARKAGNFYDIIKISDGYLHYSERRAVFRTRLDTIEKAHIPNKLNKKLYPSYVKYEGHLISPKAMDTIREHND